jgi:hypothetical protein
VSRMHIKVEAHSTSLQQREQEWEQE